MFRKPLIINAFCLFAASAVLAAPVAPSAGTAAEDAGEVRQSTPEEAAATSAMPGGQIVSQDPAVRQQVRDLHAERSRINEETLSAIQALNAQYAENTGRVVRDGIAAQLAELKAGLEIRNMELQLEIAVLNEDTFRIQELELGLERARNPEAYRAQFIDPSLGQQRLLESGLE